MDVVVVCEFRFLSTPDGKVWTASSFPYHFWQRYLAVFDNVRVVARIQEVSEPEPSWVLSSGEQVEFLPLPYYVGLAGMMKSLPGTIRALHQAIDGRCPVIYRVPSQTAMMSLYSRPFTRHRYAVEVVGDPSDVFASGIVNRFADKIIGWLSTSSMRRIVKKASAASYVTDSYLQARYPVYRGTFSTGCSSIELKPSWLADVPRKFTQPARHLVFIGSFGQLYKGPDLLLHSLTSMLKTDNAFTLTLLGEGKFRSDMQLLATQLGCEQAVNFVGEVNSQQVLEHLQKADVFVMPSRTEGLTRAMIEAMATGLPAIGSKVGGIPELLDEQHLFESEDIEGLTSRLLSLCNSTEELNRASERNLDIAKRYQKSVLDKKRTEFYSIVKQSMERD